MLLITYEVEDEGILSFNLILLLRFTLNVRLTGKDLECVVWFTENIVFDKEHKCLSSHKHEELLTIYSRSFHSA